MHGVTEAVSQIPFFYFYGQTFLNIYIFKIIAQLLVGQLVSQLVFKINVLLPEICLTV